MNKFLLMAVYGFLAISNPAGAWASDESPVCNDIDELMFSDRPTCKKGDIIIVNPMMAAFLCDMTLPNISGDKTVVCHYLGKKRPERNSKK